tara:strand:- start:586 stop:2925 length:2340 start_codon:yes stop_codon:yes gene_type:complete
MATSQINNAQLAKLLKGNKIDAKALNLTGSSLHTDAIEDHDVFVIQSADSSDGFAKHVSASLMQDYFSKTDIVDANDDDVNYEIVFVSGSGNKMDLQVGGTDVLKYNPNQNMLKTVHASGSGALSFDSGVLTSTLSVSGAISANSTITASDLINFNGGLKGTTISGSSTLEMVGASTLGGTLNVSGNATFANPISANSTITASDLINFDGGLKGTSISGSSTLEMVGATILGNTLNVSGAAVFASTMSGSDSLSAHSLDIETTGDILGAVSLGKSGGAADVTVRSDLAVQEDLTVTGFIKGAAISGSSTLEAVGVTTLGSNLNVSGAAVFASTMSGSDSLSAHSLDIETTADILGAVNLGAAGGSADVIVRSDLQVNENLTVTGDFIVNGTKTIVDTTQLQVEDTIVVLGSGSSGEASAGDRGFIFAIGSENDPAFFWDESASEFAVVRTTASHAETGAQAQISPDAYAKLHANILSASAGVVGATLTTDGAISGSSTLEAVGATTLGSTLNVSGAAVFASTISGSDSLSAHALDIETTADILGAVNLGKSGGAADVIVRSDLAVQENLTVTGFVKGAAISGSSTLEAVGDATLGSKLNVSGAVLLAGLDEVDASTIAANDMLVFQDVSATATSQSINIRLDNFASYLADGAGSAGYGLQASSDGVLGLSQVVDIASSASSGSVIGDVGTAHRPGGPTADILSASLSQTPLSSDTIEVYLNGMLQVPFASNISGTVDSTLTHIFDYQFFPATGSSGNGAVVFQNPIDTDDVIQIRYIKK